MNYLSTIEERIKFEININDNLVANTGSRDPDEASFGSVDALTRKQIKISA